MVEAGLLSDKEQDLLNRLPAEGKSTTLQADDLRVAESLERGGLLFLVKDTMGRDAASAVITPKGRRMLADQERATRPSKGPLGK